MLSFAGSESRRILGVLDALGVARTRLVGHSFGGGPTMEAVLLAPERAHALVLADAAIGLEDPPAFNELLVEFLRHQHPPPVSGGPEATPGLTPRSLVAAGRGC